jgi:hypothetical protein
MTAVLLNRTDTDIVDLSIIQTGSEESTVMLRDTLLDGSKDYHFCVSELSVPLQNIDMFGFLTSATELFSIHRRTVRGYLSEVTTIDQQFALDVLAGHMDHAEMTILSPAITAEEALRVGTAGGGPNTGRFIDPGVGVAIGDRQDVIRVALTNLYSVLPTTAYQNVSTYSLLPQRKFYDVNQFMKSLSDFARLFNRRLRDTGINGLHFGNVPNAEGRIANAQFDGVADVEFFKFYMNCDGSLVISANAFWWDHFQIRFTNTGAALLGINTDRLTERWLQGTENVIGRAITGDTNSDVGSQYPLPAGGGHGPGGGYVQVQYQGIIAGANTTELEAISNVSLFQSAECRLKITVESHLPIQAGIEIRNEKETNNRQIASAFFLNDVKVNAIWNQEGRMSSYGIESKVFSGQFALIHQHSRIKQWNRLMTSYNIMFFRFFLNVHYRYFDEVKGVWQIVIKRPTIDPTQYWAMKLRFVSDS